ncbi:hypothetical protein [Rhizobium sp.]|uniref:hypothetical protein n=1 Tax=Rhizobium sp. TaxID=391 RepID=UPI0028A9D680
MSTALTGPVGIGIGDIMTGVTGIATGERDGMITETALIGIATTVVGRKLVSTATIATTTAMVTNPSFCHRAGLDPYTTICEPSWSWVSELYDDGTSQIFDMYALTTHISRRPFRKKSLPAPLAGPGRY